MSNTQAGKTMNDNLSRRMKFARAQLQEKMQTYWELVVEDVSDLLVTAKLHIFLSERNYSIPVYEGGLATQLHLVPPGKRKAN